MTRDAGLSVTAYGSYYFLGADTDESKFEQVLETAVKLEAPVIRIWAGRKASSECSDQDWCEAIKDSRRVADMAAREHIRIAYEFHQGTLTDTNESALKLLDSVDHPNVCTFWQPPNGKETAYCLDGLQTVIDAGKLSNVHVFHWWPSHRERHLLREGTERWSSYLQRAIRAPGDRFACLEFSKDDDPANMRQDAATLIRLIREVAA
jgi:sugar phosphate isomerase/epimerase